MHERKHRRSLYKRNKQHSRRGRVLFSRQPTVHAVCIVVRSVRQGRCNSCIVSRIVRVGYVPGTGIRRVQYLGIRDITRYVEGPHTRHTRVFRKGRYPIQPIHPSIDECAYPEFGLPGIDEFRMPDLPSIFKKLGYPTCPTDRCT